MSDDDNPLTELGATGLAQADALEAYQQALADATDEAGAQRVTAAKLELDQARARHQAARAKVPGLAASDAAGEAWLRDGVTPDEEAT